jgi:hypothetical protein
MKGYLSFVLVFVSSLLILSLLSMSQAAGSVNLSKAVVVERTYGIQMNVKENLFEAARQGAMEGFADYDAAKDIRLCRHCPDHSCSPPADPPPPNICDASLCSRCFREDEARAEAEKGALSNISSLRSHVFDPDFEVQVGQPAFEVFLRSDPLARNGFALDFGRFRDPLGISVASKKLGISSRSEIPSGMVISYG